MKKIILLFFIIGLLSRSFALDGENTSYKKNALAKHTVKFVENKGQLADLKGTPLTNVLFFTSAPKVNIYITNTGLTYVFNKIIEEEDDEEERIRINHKDENKTIKKEKEEEKLTIKWSRIDVVLKGAQILKENVIKEGQSITEYNYFLAHCPNGITGIHEYEKLTIKNVYPNIDWVFYNSSEIGMKYDFIIHPGADPSQIEMIYEAQNKLKINKNGDLSIFTKNGSLKEVAPVSFLANGKSINSNFISTNTFKNNKGGTSTSVKFNFPELNFNQSTLNQTLIIDPQLYWGTFIGGNGGYQNGAEGFLGIKTDASDNVFLAGYASSTSFYPTVNPAGGAYYSGTCTGQFDATLMKVNSTGTIIWSTYYGGSLDDDFNEIVIDGNGNVAVVGTSSSANFPTASGGGYLDASLATGPDVVIAKFSNNGSRLWATYFGGNSTDIGTGITCNSSNDLFITGITTSSAASFPDLSMAGAYNDGSPSGTDMFIAKFSSGTAQLWTTFYGGSSSNERVDDIVCDPNGNIFVIGTTLSSDISTVNPGGGAHFSTPTGASRDAFIIKFNSSCAVTWATGFGGAGYDQGVDADVDNDGNLYVIGQANAGFPTLNPGGTAYFDNVIGGEDAFLSKFSNAGVLLWSTYVGGGGREYGWGGSLFEDFSVTVNKTCGDIYVGIITEGGCPVMAPCDGGYYDATFNGGNAPNYIIDQFVAHFAADGTQLWGSYIAGNAMDYRISLTVDSQGSLYAVGEWCEFSSNIGSLTNATYPLLNPGGTSYNNTFKGYDDCFIMKFTKPTFTVTVTPTITSACTCSAAATSTSTCGVTYSWNTSPVQTTATASNLCTGSYQVTVSDKMCNTVTQPISITCPVVLPVEMLNFYGKKQARTNLLSWETASEINSNFFILYRSENGLQWDSIAKIDAAGNSFNLQHYSYIDHEPHQLTYYRLKQIDYNGGGKFSHIVALENNVELTENNLVVIPNPTNSNISIQWLADTRENIKIELTDVSGKIILSKEIVTEKGLNVEEMNLSNYATGVYFISLIGTNSLVQKIQKN